MDVLIWQPIKTAPKDGKRKLILARLYHDGSVEEIDFEGSWNSYRDDPNDDLYWGWFSSGGIEEPTHWVYQPVPPKSK